MGACDEAEVFEIVGLFLLSDLGNKFDKNSLALYRDDGLALLKNSHCKDKIRKEFHQLFKENMFSLAIALPERSPYSHLFWSAFSRIRNEYGEILHISLYSV